MCVGVCVCVCVCVCVFVCVCVCVCVCSAVQLNGCFSQIEMQSREIVRLRECVRPSPPEEEVWSQSQYRQVSITEEAQSSDLSSLKSKYTAWALSLERCFYHRFPHQVNCWRRKRGNVILRIS